MLSTSEALNTLTSEKYLGQYNKLRVILPSPSTVYFKPADLIPAIKTWLGPDKIEFTITTNTNHIDTDTNICQHYSQRIIVNNTNGHNQLEVLGQPTGKLDVFNLTRDDNLINYATRKLEKYENSVQGVVIDNRNNILLPSKFKTLVHVHMPENNRVLSEKYLEYRFKLLEFGREPANIFIKQMQIPTLGRNTNNLIIGIDFSINEKEFISDERLKLIIKHINGLEIILNAVY